MKTQHSAGKKAAGFAIGCGVGVAMGVALHDVAIGCALGVALGLAFMFGSGCRRPEPRPEVTKK